MPPGEAGGDLARSPGAGASADRSAVPGLGGSPGRSTWNRLNLRAYPQMDAEPGPASLNDARTSPVIGSVGRADVLAGGRAARSGPGALSPAGAESEASPSHRIPEEGGTPAGRRLLEQLLKIF